MPTTIDSATATIEGHLRASLPGVPMRFPNAPFAVPSGQLWLDIDAMWGAGALRSMKGEQRNAVIGVLHINVFMPESIGQGQARRIADRVRDALNRKTLVSGTGEPIYFDVPSGLIAHRTETIESKAWDVSSITCSLQVEEVLS